MILETVKVKSDNKAGYVIINKSDFDKDKHKEYSEPKKKAASDNK